MSLKPAGEKTEQPTPKRLRDARLKGQVARSQEMVTTISLLAIIGYVWLNWSAIYARLILNFDHAAAYAAQDFSQYAIAATYDMMWGASLLLLPVIGITIVAGLAANFIQVGALVSVDAIKPKSERLNPGTGAKRIFSSKQIIELLKTTLKICVLALLLYIVIRGAISPYVNSLNCGLSCLSSITVMALNQTLFYAAICFIVVALADFAYQQRAHTKSLMMTRDEIKREHKEMEGNPLIKRKRRQFAQELALEDRGDAARKATAVVVNPTHLAVAIYYSAERAPVPLVTAKGRNREAHTMIRLAEEAGVPIFRNINLARTLYADAELFQPIPDEMFDAVAEVLAWVATHKDSLYSGKLEHGVIEMDDLRQIKEKDSS